MKTNSELKNRAIDALTGNWGLGAVITLVYGLALRPESAHRLSAALRQKRRLSVRYCKNVH